MTNSNNILDLVRLEKFQLDAIVSAFTKSFLAHDKLWLFGSRVNLNERGGDIDLYIETNYENADKAYQAEKEFLQQVWADIGDQKIDIVMNMLKSEHKSIAIYDTARNEGVRLV